MFNSKFFQKLLWIVPALLLAGTFLNPASVEAVLLPQVYCDNFQIETTTVSPGQTINGKVTILNYENSTVNDLKIHLLILDKNTDDTKIISEKKLSESFSIASNQKIKEQLSFSLPAKLPQGNFEMELQIHGGQQGQIASAAPIPIQITGEGKFLNIDSIQILKDGEKLSAGAGVNFDQYQQPKVQLNISNTSAETITAFPVYQTHKRSLSNPTLKESEGNPISLAAGESVQIQREVSAPNTAGTYLTKTKLLQSKTNEQISNSMIARWIKEGIDADIISVETDKETYTKNEQAKVTVNLAGVPETDIHSGGEGELTVEIYNNQDNQVGKKSKKVEIDSAKITTEVPLKEGVVAPKINTKIAKDEETLDEYEIKIKTTSPPKKTDEKTTEKEATTSSESSRENKSLAFTFIIGIIIIILFGAIVFFRSQGQKNDPNNLLILFSVILIVISGILFFQNQTESALLESTALSSGQPDQEVTGGCCETSTKVETESPSDNEYHPGDQIKLDGTFQVTSCGNGLFFNKVSFYIAEDKDVPLTDCCNNSTSNCNKNTRCACKSCPECNDKKSNSICGCKEGQNCYGASSSNYDNCLYEKTCRKVGTNYEGSTAIGDLDGDGSDEIAHLDEGQWKIDTNGDHQWDPSTDTTISYNAPGDMIAAGDLDDDGNDELISFEKGTWYVDTNNNQNWDGDGTDLKITDYGSTNDHVAAGDIDEDNKDEIITFKNGNWWADTNNNYNYENGTDLKIKDYGNKTDRAGAGDINDDGSDEITTFEESTYWADTNNNYQWDGHDSGDLKIKANYNYTDFVSYKWRQCFKWFDQVKKLNLSGQKIQKLGTIYPGDVDEGSKPYKVNFAENLTIPEDLDIKGGARLYTVYSGTHWRSHWHWSVTYKPLEIIPKNEPPYSENHEVERTGNFCEASKNAKKFVSYSPKWTFKDDKDDYEDTLQAYKIQIQNQDDKKGKWKIGSPDSPLDIADGKTVKRPLKVYSDDWLTSDLNKKIHLGYDQDYNWRVDVQDSIGAWSGWSSWHDDLNIPPRYPQAQFVFRPDEPAVKTEITLDGSDSKAFEGPAKLSWDLDDDGNWEINATTNKIVTHRFNESGVYPVTLKVEDSSPKTSACFDQKNIKVKPKQGRPEEVIPE